MTGLTPRQLELAADGTLTVAGAAAFSGLSKSKLWQLEKAKKVPSALIDGRRLFSKRGLAEYLARHFPTEG